MLPAGSLSASRRGVIHHAFALAPESVQGGLEGTLSVASLPFARGLGVPPKRCRKSSCRESEGVRRGAMNRALPRVSPRVGTRGLKERSEATKQSRGGVMWSDKRVDCRASSSLGFDNGSQ